MKTYDLIIIGGGPIGICCAIEAKKAGLDYLVLEKGVLVNSLYNFPTNMTFFSTSNLLEIGEVPFISHSEKPTRKESLEYFRRVFESWELNMNFYETVLSMQAAKNKEGVYHIKSSKSEYETNSVIVATGFYDTPRLMNIPGEDLPKVKHYYDEVHPYMNQKVLVIGAANSSCDVALETYYKGAQVTMAVRGEAINPRVKYWIKPNIENRIKEGSIKAYFNTTVEEIKPSTVILNTPDGQLELDNDFVLAMTGYKPDYPLLDALGIVCSDDQLKAPIHNEETLESSLPNVYLAGVVLGGMKTSTYFIENSRHHANLIVDDIISKRKVNRESLAYKD